MTTISAERIEGAVHPTTPALTGRLDLAGWSGRGILALLTEIANKATISIIDPATSQAIATSVTDGKGEFTLTFSGDFVPNGQPYLLEAFKGLSDNAAGHSAARLRTLVRFAGGVWESIGQGGILISRSTTALCAAASLKQGILPAPVPAVDFAQLFGKLTPGAGPDINVNYDTIGSIPFISNEEYQAAWNGVRDSLAADLDPIASLIFDPTNTADPESRGFFRYTPGSGLTLDSQTPIGPLAEGGTVTLRGLGFDSSAEVRFGGVLATNQSVSPTILTVWAPQLIPGSVTVKVRGVVYQGPPYTVQPGVFPVATTTRYLYTGPVGTGNDSMTITWNPNPAALGYLVSIGSAPGGGDVASAVAGKVSTLTFQTGRTLKGAWTGTTYYLTVQPILPNVKDGKGTAVTLPIQLAEAKDWDGVGTPDNFRTNDRGSANPGGYAKDFPGPGVTQFWGHHYFESVTVAGTTHVCPFGYVDSNVPGMAMSDPKVGNPKDGFLAIHANTITVTGTIDASGRGYGGGPGLTTRGGVFDGKGGSYGLSGDGGSSVVIITGNGWNAGSGAGGQGRGGAGGGAQGPIRGGNGGLRGGGGGGGDVGCGSGYNGPIDADDTTGAGGYGSGHSGVPDSSRGGTPPWGGGQGAHDNTNSTSGGGGAGYGAGGGAGGGDCSDAYDGGGGGGGTGGYAVNGTVSLAPGYTATLQRTGHSSWGLGWAPGVMYGNTSPSYGNGGPAGRYMPGPDTSTDASFKLGSGGAGGDHSNQWQCCGDGARETSGGAGGGAGGGAIILDAGQALDISGKLYAVGASGGGGAGDDMAASVGGGGGGGSGGTIIVRSNSVTFTGTANALGGTDGETGNVSTGSGGNGGNGGASTTTGGTIKILATTLVGTYTAQAKRIYVGTY